VPSNVNQLATDSDQHAAGCQRNCIQLTPTAFPTTRTRLCPLSAAMNVSSSSRAKAVSHLLSWSRALICRTHIDVGHPSSRPSVEWQGAPFYVCQARYLQAEGTSKTRNPMSGSVRQCCTLPDH
jgi:hypothetical protein